MCGIIGYIGKKEAAPVLFNSLKNLEYRGYDSFGFATVHDNKIWVEKRSGKISEFEFNGNLPGFMGIAHTRWATHGKPSKENAHPHLCCEENIAIVHNGIISNFLYLKKELIKKGHVFKSETDSEVIAHLIEENYKGDLEEAVRKALKHLKGTYALLITSKNENKIIGVRKESPLVLGISDSSFYLSSDIASFLEFTNNTVLLEDGEMVIIKPEGYEIKDFEGNVISKRALKINWNPENVKKNGYPHFMLKEICEEPEIVKKSLKIAENEIKEVAKLIKEYPKVYIVGIGTSFYAGLISEYWFSKISKKTVNVIDSSEFMEKALPDNETLIIAITQSGETYDTLQAMRHAKSLGSKIVSIVNVLGSSATRESEISILQGCGLEIGVCATKTFISQLIILLRLALELAKLKGMDISKIENELKDVSNHIEKIINEKERFKEIAKYCDVKNYVYIGRGINYPMALEGALKFKEISYLHAEGMSSGFLKHGTISLIDKDFYTIALIPQEDRKILSNIQEIKSRGGKVIGIVLGDTEYCDVKINLPIVSDIISPLIFAPACQLLAYYVAVGLGKDPDKPRNLAKSVTVE